MNQYSQELGELYKQGSKHSNYQLLHPELAKIIDQDIETKSRHEKERLDYFLKCIEFQGKSVADIGGNTGYFSFAAVEHGAACVDYFEGNPVHAEFVKLACRALNVEGKITVYPEYIDLDNEDLRRSVDVIFLLNVLHHIGDDYGDSSDGFGNVLAHVKTVVQRMASQARYMIFQLGFNWKGDRNFPLFPNGTKSEMTEFVRNICSGYWDIEKIGVAEIKNGIIKYNDVSLSNSNRNNALGEFLNRPLYIMKSSRI